MLSCQHCPLIGALHDKSLLHRGTVTTVSATEPAGFPGRVGALQLLGPMVHQEAPGPVLDTLVTPGCSLSPPTREFEGRSGWHGWEGSTQPHRKKGTQTRVSEWFQGPVHSAPLKRAKAKESDEARAGGVQSGHTFLSQGQPYSVLLVAARRVPRTVATTARSQKAFPPPCLALDQACHVALAPLAGNVLSAVLP